MRVEDVMNQCDLTPLDCQTLIRFTRYKNTHLSASGIYLEKNSRVQIHYDNSTKNSQARNKVCGEKGLVTSSDKLLSEFISLYKSNKYGIQNRMVVLLLQSLVT